MLLLLHKFELQLVVDPECFYVNKMFSPYCPLAYNHNLIR